MKRVVLVALLAFPTLGVSCDGVGTFDGGVGVDAGPIGPGTVPLSSIGKTCSYDPNDPNAPNPTNDCDTGLECLIFTRDGVYTSGLALSAWEDQFTIYQSNPDVDVGYCTPAGVLGQTFACPAGSAPKLLSPNILVCLKLCNTPADCGRSDYTCDVRYFDVVDNQGNELPTCVRKCDFDVPTCVRSGVVQSAQNAAVLEPELVFEDLAGGAECGGDGICQAVTQHGVAKPGEPCTRTEDCSVGSACIQAPILNAVLGAGNEASTGFCASPCKPDTTGQTPQGTCTDGFICQSAGALNLGFADPANGIPGPIVRSLASGGVDTVGGFCFHQCQLGVQADCSPFAGTVCGSLDEARVGDTWNQVPQCLPDALAN